MLRHSYKRMQSLRTKRPWRSGELPL